MKKQILLLIVGILFLSLTFVQATLTTSTEEIKLDSVATKDVGKIKVYQIDDSNVRIFRVMEDRKMIGRGIIFKKDLAKSDDIDAITFSRVKIIVDKKVRKELVITKPSFLTKLINIITK